MAVRMGEKCSVCGGPAVSKTFLEDGEVFFRCDRHLHIDAERYKRGEVELVSRQNWRDALISDFAPFFLRDDNTERDVERLLRDFAARIEAQLARDRR